MMAAPLEVLLSSDSGSQLWNCTVFDPHSGSSLLSYRGGNSGARSLTVLGGEYLLSAQLGKNFINVWELQRKVGQHLAQLSPPRSAGDSHQSNAPPPSADRGSETRSPSKGVCLLCFLTDQVCTGKLQSVLSRHYQDVTCLKFTDDSSHFVSGGKDNLALVWSLSSVVQLDVSHAPEPRHIMSRHSLPITDLHCGLMGAQARVATASLDQTVKVWELSSGELLLSILFDVEIMSVTFDPAEYFVFCGGSDGNIFQVSLCSQTCGSLLGLRNMVTCLSVSMDGTLLLSGSHDETVRLWDIQSKQSIRCLTHKGPVTNAIITPAPANMFLPDSRPAVPLPRFSRHLHASESDGGEPGEVCVRLRLHTQEEEETYLQKADTLNSLMNAVTEKSVFGDGENTKVRIAELEEEVQTLKKMNKDLYDFSSQMLTKPT
ncbi:WD repeat-containing protein 18 [Neolamprologus brichardi]|uniref:WD repeat-containing protein 18 n=1 Tax=Neolamprologus brichardi TaxID=32507 RepID=UPI00164394E9|nr:WD repeat-containing protein 18 [Neolamprologus brichardi]